MQIIRKNFGLKILALALAIVGWAYFRFAANPIFAAHFDQQLSVPITAANLPVGFIAHFTDKEAVVTIANARGEPAIKPDEIKAVLDLSGKGAGIFNVPVQLVAPDVAVQSLSPASVTLTIERIEARSYPLAIHYTGQPGGGIVVGSSSLAPQSVTVHGPSGLLTQVAAVRVDVPLAPSPSALDAMVRPVPVDSTGQEIGDLQVAPDLVRVRVQFVKGTGAGQTP